MLREQFWKWRRKRLGKSIKRGEISALGGVLAPRVSLDEILTASIVVARAIPRDLIDRFRGEEIALVGPGEQGLAEGALSRVPVIARMGYLGPESVPQQTTSRCDVSFYTGNAAGRLRDGSGPTLWHHLPPLAVFRREVAVSSLVGLPDRVRAISFDDGPVKAIFKGIIPNFAPEVIVFLLALGPSRLTITHVDLFTTARYPAGYVNKNIVGDDGVSYIREREAVRRSMSWHNPFTHFSFYRALAGSQSIVLSDQLAAIVAGGPRAYRDRIAALYFDA